MNTTKLLITAALLVASASVSFAGPGAQYWQQRRNPPASEKKDTTVVSENQPDSKSTAAERDYGCQGCSSCKAKG